MLGFQSMGAKVEMINRGIIRIFNPWVPNFCFTPKSRPKIAFLGWFQAFSLKSMGAKRHVLKLMGTMAPVAPMLTSPPIKKLAKFNFSDFHKSTGSKERRSSKVFDQCGNTVFEKYYGSVRNKFQLLVLPTGLQ